MTHDPYRAPHRTFTTVTGAGKNPDPVDVTTHAEQVEVDDALAGDVPDTAAEVVDWIEAGGDETAQRAAAAWSAELDRSAGPRKTVATAVSAALAPDAPPESSGPADGDEGADQGE